MNNLNSKIGVQYFIDNILDIIAELDLDGTLTYVSSQVYDMLGYYPEEIIGDKFFKFIHPDDLPILMEQLKRKNKSEKFNVEFKVQHKSGNYIVVSVKGSLIKINGEPKLLGVLRDISREKEAEEKFIESEKKYKNILKNINETYFEVDINGNFTFFNDAISKYTGYTSEELMNMHYSQLFDVENRSEIFNVFNNLYKTGKGSTLFDSEIIKKNRERLFVESSVYLRYDSKGEIIGFRGLVRDITERKKTEEELKKSEEKYRTFFESCLDAVVITGLDGSILDCNKVYSDMLGYTLEELKELTFHQLTPEKWHEMEAEILKKQFIERGYSDEYEKEYIRKDGTIFPVSLRGWAIYDENGKVISLWGFVRDITEHKKKEEEIRLQSEIIENMSEGVYLIKLDDGTIVYTNPVFETMFGYNPGEMIGKNVAIVNAPAGKTSKETRDKIMEILKETGEWHGEVLNIKKDGTPFWCYANVSLFDHPEYGRVIVSVHTDITERKKAEEELKTSEKRFRTIAENFPNGAIVLYDHDLRYLLAEGEVIEKVGLTSEKMVGNNLRDLVPDEYYNALAPHYKAALNGETHRFEFEFGGIIHDTSTLPIKDSDGDIIAGMSISHDITERKKIEQKLKESEEKWRAITKYTPDHIAVLDKDAKFLFINYTSPDLTVDEVFGKSVFDFVQKEYQELQRNVYNEVLSTGKVIHFETGYVDKDGNQFYFDVSAGPLFKDGKVIGIITRSTDITERKETERKLKKSEEQLRLERDNLKNILNSMKDGVYIVNQHYDIEYVNPILIEEFGPFEKKKCFEYFHDREEVCPWCKNQEVFTGKTVRWEWFSFKNQKTYDLVDTPLKNPDGSISKLEIFHDITERKQAEDILRLHSEIMTNMAEGACLTGTDDAIFVYTNPRFEKMFGYKPGEMIGKHVSIMNAPTDKNPEETAEKILEILERTGEWHGEVNNIKKDGTLFLCYANISIFNHHKYGRVHVTVIADITERKKMEYELKEYRDHLEYMVGERIKELNCLYELSKIFEEKEVTKEEILRRTVGLFPPAWQYPDITCVRIIVDSQEYKTENFKETKWKQASDIIVDNEKVGDIEIYYLEEKPEFDEGPFMKEERDLINAMAERLGKDFERLSAEKQLQETNEMLEQRIKERTKDIVDLAKFPSENPNPILRVCKEKIIYTNKAGENIFTIKKDDMIPTLIQEGVNEAFSTNELKTIEIEVNDSIYSFDINPIKEEGYANIYGKNITERKKSEEITLASERKLKNLMEAIPIGISISTPEGEISEINAQAYKIFGYSSKEEFLKLPAITHYYNPKDRKKYVKLLDSGIVNNFEVQFKRKNGTLFWGSLTSIAQRVGDHTTLINTFQDITDRKKNEEEIADLAKFPKENPNPVLRVSKEFVLYTNQSGQDLLNIKIGDRIPIILREIIKKVFEENVNQNLEVELNNHIYSLFVNPIKGTSYINVYGMDITERKKKEEELRMQSEIIENMSEGVYLIKLDDETIVYTNPVFDEMFGYNPGEMLRKNVAIVNAQTDKTPEETKNEIVGILKDTGEWHGEVLNIKKDGTSFWCYANVSLFDHPEFGRVIVSVHTDITERRKAEQALKESEEKYRKLIETSSMGLLELDIKKGGVLYVNPRLLKIVGYTQDELISKGMFYKVISPDDYKKITKSDEDQDIELRIINKEGKIKWLSGRTLHHFNEQGEVIYLRLWLQDITEAKELEEIKSSLLTRISHEFKTPLISIKGFTDLMLTEYVETLDERIISFLEKIKAGGERLKSLINTFIEGSQLDKDLVELDLKREDLSILIKSSLEQMEGVIRLREHTIDLKIDNELITNFDKQRIESVFTNLLINAIYYTPKGGNIKIQSKIKKNSIIISVEDNGIGLTKKELSQLFEPFGKVERFGKRWDIISEGMGMGLYISREIINLHKGKILAESEGINKGSKFSFSLPIVEN